MSEGAEKIVRVRIAGRVQGVGYRGWTVREAHRLQLRGWVRNLSSGEVEAVFAGPEDAVDSMLARCLRGPHHAVVASVTPEPADGSALPPSRGFQQIGTV